LKNSNLEVNHENFSIKEKNHMAIRKPTLSDEARSTKKLHLLKGSEKEGSKANQTDFL